MSTTSIGVYGFLSKAHLEQGASTLDNGAKVVRLEEQISQEKSKIVDNQRVIDQMDATIKSYLDSGAAARSISARNKQKVERENLRKDTEAIQKRIDDISQERFALQSEVRKLELEVGPIRYIAELIYGAAGDPQKNIESAIRAFSSLLVLSLDPLAIALLIAANHTLIRLQNEKKEKDSSSRGNGPDVAGSLQTPGDPEPENRSGNPENRQDNETVAQVEEPVQLPQIPDNITETRKADKDAEVHVPIYERSLEILNIDAVDPTPAKITIIELPSPVLRNPEPSLVGNKIATALQPKKSTAPWLHQGHILDELLGTQSHFIPQKLAEVRASQPIPAPVKKTPPEVLSWLKEFKRT